MDIARRAGEINWKVYGLKQPIAEYRFFKERKWRFDYAWVEEKIAVEIEGGVWSGGRHTRGSGFIKDMEKYNMANKLGWRVFRFTPQQIDSGDGGVFMREVFGMTT